jgi:hypothetical protein
VRFGTDADAARVICSAHGKEICEENRKIGEVELEDKGQSRQGQQNQKEGSGQEHEDGKDVDVA